MSENHFKSHDDSYSHSFNCVDVFIDEPGDTTVRPIPAKDIDRVKALRDRIQAALAAGIDLSEQEIYLE